MPFPDISEKKCSWITLEAEDVVHSLRKTGPLLSQLAPLLELPQANLLMHIRKFQKQPQLLLPHQSSRTCHYLKMLSLLRVPSPLILILMSLQATSSPDCTALELRKTIAMTLILAAKGPLIALRRTTRNRLKKTIHQLQIFIPDLWIWSWLS